MCSALDGLLASHNSVVGAAQRDPRLRPVQRHTETAELPPQAAVKIEKSEVKTRCGPDGHA